MKTKIDEKSNDTFLSRNEIFDDFDYNYNLDDVIDCRLEKRKENGVDKKVDSSERKPTDSKSSQIDFLPKLTYNLLKKKTFSQQ